MNLKSVYNRMISLEIDVVRSMAHNYYELVLFNTQREQWGGILKDFFGSPAKPAGSAPNDEEWELTKVFGGVRTEQTLYRRDEEDQITIAMLWPWQNGRQTTLKMYVLKGDSSRKFSCR